MTWRQAPNDSHATNTYKQEARMVRGQTNKLKKKIDLYGNQFPYQNLNHI